MEIKDVKIIENEAGNLTANTKTSIQSNLGVILIDKNSMKPQYLQLADFIMNEVLLKHLKTGDFLPSINKFCVELQLSKNTVEKAYNTLKHRGIIGSYRGKGYFVFDAAAGKKG